MKVLPIDKHTQKTVEMEGASGARMRMLIGPEDGAATFHMRHFEIAPGGFTPHHSHDYEHEIVVLAGTGVAKSAGGDRPLRAGDIVFVPANERHQFLNAGKDPLQFICLIPAPHACAK